MIKSIIVGITVFLSVLAPAPAKSMQTAPAVTKPAVVQIAKVKEEKPKEVVKPKVKEKKPEPVTEPVKKEVPVVKEAPPEPVKAPVANGGCELAYNYDWPKNVAYAVCMGESGGNQNAANWRDNHGSCVGSFGLMQVGCFWFPYYGYSVDQAHDPSVNMQVAYNIYARQGGFGAWSAYTNGSYAKYLK